MLKWKLQILVEQLQKDGSAMHRDIKRELWDTLTLTKNCQEHGENLEL